MGERPTGRRIFQFILDDTDGIVLKTIIKIERKREFKNSDRPVDMPWHYITSLAEKPPKDVLVIIRSQREIENKLNWCLDIAFRENEIRKRKDKAAVNFAILKKIVLNRQKADKSKKGDSRANALQQVGIMSIWNIF